jgi:hypothetical membrane protein
MQRRTEPATAFPVAITPVVMFGAVCWTLSVLYFPAQAIVQAASARPYSLATQVISDLGNTACGPAVCSPLHGLMNATFIAVGLLHAAGALTAQQAWPPGKQRTLSAALLTRTLGAALLVLAGNGLLWAGASPENVDPAVHKTAALMGLAGLNAGMLVLGLMTLPLARRIGVLAIAAGTVGGLGLLLLLRPALGLPPGITERVADYPGAVMIVVLGALLLGRIIRAGRTLVSPIS